MIFTTPITNSPEEQLATGVVPVRRVDDSNFANYEILSGMTEELNAFNKTDLNPSSRYAYVLKYCLSIPHPSPPPAGTRDLITQFEGDQTSTDDVLGWNAQPLPIGEVRIPPKPFLGRDYYPDDSMITHVYLIPRSMNLNRVRIKIRLSALRLSLGGNMFDLKWVLFERVIGYIYPTLSFKGRLARARTTRKSITGQEFNTASSPAQVFSAPLVLKNDPRDEVGVLLNSLDELPAFGVIPNGLDQHMLTSSIPYRQDGFTRNMLVARGFRGFAGHQGIDTHGASGRIELRETYHVD